MAFTSPFIVYRMNTASVLEEAFHTEELKKAKYWLQYIAVPGDVLCRTPAHPKYGGQGGAAEYWQHKDAKGKLALNFDDWKKWATSKGFTGVFPAEQLKTSTE